MPPIHPPRPYLTFPIRICPVAFLIKTSLLSPSSKGGYVPGVLLLLIPGSCNINEEPQSKVRTFLLPSTGKIWLIPNFSSSESKKKCFVYINFKCKCIYVYSSLSGLLNTKMSHQNKDVLHASLVKLLHHFWQIPESPGVKGEYPSLVCIIQVIPLYILLVKTLKYSQEKSSLMKTPAAT